jgi:hypothetical protein
MMTMTQMTDELYDLRYEVCVLRRQNRSLAQERDALNRRLDKYLDINQRLQETVQKLEKETTLSTKRRHGNTTTYGDHNTIMTTPRSIWATAAHVDKEGQTRKIKTTNRFQGSSSYTTEEEEDDDDDKYSTPPLFTAASKNAKKRKGQTSTAEQDAPPPKHPRHIKHTQSPRTTLSTLADAAESVSRSAFTKFLAKAVVHRHPATPHPTATTTTTVSPAPTFADILLRKAPQPPKKNKLCRPGGTYNITGIQMLSAIPFTTAL